MLVDAPKPGGLRREETSMLWRHAFALTSDEGVGGSLERSEAVANDEDAGAEAAKGGPLQGRNGKQRAEGVEAETPDEDGAVAIVAKDPSSVADGGERVCARTREKEGRVSKFWWLRRGSELEWT